MGQIIDFMMRDFVLSWWHDMISEDSKFPDELKATILVIVGDLSRRAMDVNILACLIDVIDGGLCDHLRWFAAMRKDAERDNPALFDDKRHARGPLLGPDRTVMQRREAAIVGRLSRAGKLHPALGGTSYTADSSAGGGGADGGSTTQKPELAYLRHLSKEILRHTLPAGDYRCRLLRYITIEILSSKVLLLVMGFVTPYWINYGFCLLTDMLAAAETEGAGGDAADSEGAQGGVAGGGGGGGGGGGEADSSGDSSSSSSSSSSSGCASGSSDDGDLVLEALHHPLVEAASAHPGGYITSDAVLRRASSRFVIVTGPNMGGKSTYLRAVALAVVMAQVGAFVPAAAARVPLRDAVFARVGAADDMARGVSTFMAEMLEVGAILRQATAHSLVIIDELGRGTSTSDGFGIAWAISQHLACTLRPLCLFATHFHELTALAACTPGVANRHVTALTGDGTDVASSSSSSSSLSSSSSSSSSASAVALSAPKRKSKSSALTFLYEVRDGACDRSFGIHVAELARFPAAVVAEARARADELEATARQGQGGAEQQHAGAKRKAQGDPEG